jgi:hypothetical protein
VPTIDRETDCAFCVPFSRRYFIRSINSSILAFYPIDEPLPSLIASGAYGTLVKAIKTSAPHIPIAAVVTPFATFVGLSLVRTLCRRRLIGSAEINTDAGRRRSAPPTATAAG